MPRLLESIAKQREQIWTAPGEAIARWWRERAAVKVSTREERGALSIQLATARGPVRNLALVVFPPVEGVQPRLDAGATSARLEKLDGYRWAIVVPELREGMSELRVGF